MLPRRLAAMALGVAVATAGCTDGSGSDDPAPGSSTVQAFPELPHVDGPFRVQLRPALPLLLGDRRCRRDLSAHELCSSDGSGGYKVLGPAGHAVVDRVTTAPSTDHTSWGTRAVFAAGSRDDVRRAGARAAAFGGVVVVTVGSSVVTIVPPPDLKHGEARFLGLQKAEAWAIVDAFKRAQTRSK